MVPSFVAIKLLNSADMLRAGLLGQNLLAYF
eukprot:SAG11_NODE_260_length_11531_cov_6.271781_13_plen_31_part_00